jgi:hypothetical protein
MFVRRAAASGEGPTDGEPVETAPPELMMEEEEEQRNEPAAAAEGADDEQTTALGWKVHPAR